MKKPYRFSHIRNITISGRISTGQSTLARQLAETLGWEMLEGGKLFRAFMKEQGESVINTAARPDDIDLAYEKKVKKMLTEQSEQVIQSHLAGFDAQGIAGVFKILLVCEDKEGNDRSEIRIDRLMNREGVSVEEAKHEVREREASMLEKWRRLYVQGDPEWIYWDKKYYDFIVNTFSNNQEESLKLVLKELGYQA